MIDFPVSTIVHRRLPKEAFYKHLHLSAALKSSFVSDVGEISVANSLTKKNLNLEKETDTKEILLLVILLKKRAFDGKILEVIARQNPHKLVFLLSYEQEVRLAVYHKKLYYSAWMPEDDIELTLSGETLDAIWDDLVRQIALHSPSVEQRTESLEQQLKHQGEIDRLNKLIKKTEAAAWKEAQPKKRFAIYTQLQEYKQKLEELTHGEA